MQMKKIGATIVDIDRVLYVKPGTVAEGVVFVALEGGVEVVVKSTNPERTVNAFYAGKEDIPDAR